MYETVESMKKIKKETNQENLVYNEVERGFFARFTFLWFTGFMRAAFGKPLMHSDLGNAKLILT